MNYRQKQMAANALWVMFAAFIIILLLLWLGSMG